MNKVILEVLRVMHRLIASAEFTDSPSILENSPLDNLADEISAAFRC